MNSKLFFLTLLLCSFCFRVLSQVVPQGSLSGNAICAGGLPTLTFTATAGTGPFTVRYTDGNAIRTQTGVTSGSPFNAVSTTTVTKTYTLLKVTGSDGGTRSSGFTDATGTVTVSARPDLKSLTLSPITPVCAGSNATLSLSGFVQNQSFQSKPAISTVANGAFSVYSADLDGDGDLDVLSASAIDDKIAWYKNDGRGGFTEQTAISTSADVAWSVYSADLDGDGDLDVLSASAGDYKIAWYKNDGNGGFTEQTAIGTSAKGARSVYAADLDGDGDLDVLSASQNDDKIAWYKNNGSGGFTEQTAISTSAIGAVSVYAADLDGDGDLDVLSASGAGDKIAWYQNDGSGVFTTQLAISTSADGARSVYAADLDGDGDIDVLSASGAGDKIAWYQNDGRGGFTEQPAISTSADGAWSVYAADFDGDGDMDVLSASAFDDKIAWYKNNGSGIFTEQTAISTSANGADSVYAADLDGDGDLDVLSASNNGGKIEWYENRTPFSGSATITYTAGGGEPQTATSAVSMGMATFVLPAPKAGTLTLLKVGNTNGCTAGVSKTTPLRHLPSPDLKDLTLAPVAPVCAGSNATLSLSGFVQNQSFQTRPPLSTSASFTTSVYAADLDGDGDIDVLSTSVNNDKIAWYKNDGSGGFTEQTAISTLADGAWSVYAADLDGDGDMDVLSASQDDDKIAWYKNDGSGVFTTQPAISTSANGAVSVYAADLDGDGDMDVLSASVNDDKIAWYKNDGSGSFTEQPAISTSADVAFSVYAADLDGDGDLDVLSASRSDNKIAWYKNDGNGGFTTQPVISTSANGAFSVYAADLDGDGDQDVLSASFRDNKIAWYKNDGSGGFIEQTAISTSAITAFSVYAADMDGDGDLDVLSASTSDNKIAWYKNDGIGGFTEQTPISTSANGAWSVYSADLDGDGDLDVLSASQYDNKIMWYENRTPFSGNASVSYKINSGSPQTTPITVSSGSASTVIASPVSGTLQLSKISATNGCETAVTTATSLSVDLASVGGTVSSAQSICTGTSPANLTLSGQVGNVLKWQKASDAAFSSPVDIASTSTTLTSALMGTLTANTYFRAVVKNGLCNEVNSSAVLISVNLLPTATISGATTVCQNGTSPAVTLVGSNGTAPYTFMYKINDGVAQTVKTASGNSVTVSVPTTVTGVFTYSLVSVSENSPASCGQLQSGSVEIKVQGKPTITLSTLQQRLNEGNNQTLCDTDANPVNSLQFGVITGCVVGTPVWRVQVGTGSWSDWSTNAPVSQPSNNQSHRYQAACDASCPATYTSTITVQINYRASTPQQVSLVADGVTVNEGESKEVCNIEGNTITFNATCTAGEVLLYSVDGGDYSSAAPTQLVDGQFHNYRVRCRKSDGTASCIESESGVMRLKLTNGLGQVPVAILNVTSGCGTPVSFSGTASCGSLTTVWYNASTNVALATLPSQTPTETTSYYARCQAGGGCLSEKSNVVTYTVIPVGVAPVVSVSSEVVCSGTSVTISANCPAGSTTSWNTGVTTPSFEISFSNVTKQTYWAKCVFSGGCQSAESVKKEVYWNAFVVTLINVGQTKSAVKSANDKALWSSQFIAKDGGPELVQSTQSNPTLYYAENVNKAAPRYWTINVDACGLGTEGSLTFDLLATPETGVPQSFNTHENNAPYFMYANRDGWTELYAQNHPAYGFYQDNGVGGNVYDLGLPKGLYKLGVRYWDQKGWGSIYPSTRKPQGNVLAYQEYWFRIQSKDGVGVGAARTADSGLQEATDLLSRRFADARDLPPNVFAQVMPNPVASVLRLQVQGSKGQEVNATLLDASGRELSHRNFVPETNMHQEEFEVSQLPTGMYFLQVVTAEKRMMLKAVKVE